jgi:Mrp family chromosome partitioning ATPase/capsular polysaccharide biosynthesis protein
MNANDAATSRAAPIDYAPGLLRGAAWVLLCTALVAAAAFGFSKLQTKKYTAAASLVFNDNRLGRQLAGLPLATTSGAQGQQASDLKLVRSAGAAAETARALDHGLTAAKVRAALRISAPGAWNVVKASATTSSRALAAAIANTYTAQFVEEQRRLSHGSYAAAVKRAHKQLSALSRTRRFASAGLALRVRAQALRTLSRLGADNVQIAHAAAVPTSPSSPRVARNTILGAVIGLLLGLGSAFWHVRRQRRIRNPEQLRQIYGVPLLGVIPESAALARLAASRRADGSEQSSATLPRREEEAFELIRGHLRYFKIDRELRTLLVVSACRRDGSTTIARHLAATAARTGSVVLLVEADLLHPALAAQLRLQAEPGLSAALIGELSLWSATQLVDVGFPRRDGQVANTPSSERVLDVVAAGEPLPPNPVELMKSRAMAALLEEARSTYDLVVIDTPALAASADALSLVGQVDGVIVVGRMGGRGGPAERARAILARSRAPLLGVVANGATRGWRRRSQLTQDYDDARALTSPALDASANGGSPPGAGVEQADPRQTERRGREPQPH